MARSEINTEFNTFVGGILTEANPINYPAGYSLDEENFILKRNGTRERRKGLKLDTTAADLGAKALTLKTDAGSDTTEYVDCFLWENPSLNTENSTYSMGFVFDLIDESDTTIDLDEAAIITYDLTDPTDVTNTYLAGTDLDVGVYTASSIYKKQLLVTGRTYGNIFGFSVAPQNDFYKYDGTTTLNEIASSTLKVRDFSILGDAVSSSNPFSRPTSISLGHMYDMANAGWLDADITTVYTALSAFPSVSDNPIFAKDKGSAVSSTYVQNTLVGYKYAPRGKSIINLLSDPFLIRAGFINQTLGYDIVIDSTYQGVTVDETDLMDTNEYDNASGATVDIVPFGGRMFYLSQALKYSAYGSAVVSFSQLDDSGLKFGHCFQINDPTSEDINTPLDTDGGAVDLSSIGEPLRISAGRSRLLVFGTEAVYELYSSSDVFKPVDIGIREVSKSVLSNYSDYKKDSTAITGLGVRRPTAASIVSYKDSFFYWSSNGIINLTYNKDAREFDQNNLTDSSIQTLYNGIPDNCKAAAKGAFSEEDTAIIWCYSDDTTKPKKFNKALVYDLVLNAWTKFNFYTDDSCYILDLKAIPSFINSSNTADFLGQIVFVVETPDKGVTTAYFGNDTFEDFSGSTNSGERQAFLQTGYLNANDSAVQKQSNYITTSFLRTEDGFTDDGSGNLTPTNESSCKIKAYWDFADDDVSGKINDEFEAYRYTRLYIPADASDPFNYGQSVLTTKNRLTGRGRALSLRFETSAGKDCKLLGWNLGFGGNSKV